MTKQSAKKMVRYYLRPEEILSNAFVITKFKTREISSLSTMKRLQNLEFWHEKTRDKKNLGFGGKALIIDLLKKIHQWMDVIIF